MKKPLYNFNAIPIPNWKQTLSALSEAIKTYDKDKPKSERINICAHLIESIYEDFMKKYPKGLTKNGSFCATHTYYEGFINRSERTVFRQLNKLVKTPFIKEKNIDRCKFEGKEYSINCVRLTINLDYVKFKYTPLKEIALTLPQIAKKLSTLNVDFYVEDVLRRLIYTFIMFARN